MQRWPHQIRFMDQVPAAIEAGERRICVTSPTGGGKSTMMLDLIRWGRAFDWNITLYTNRIMLREQIGRGLTENGIEFGVRAAGEEPEFWQPIQLSQMQTEEARVFKSNKWKLHRSKLVIIDEAHNQKEGVAQKIVEKHIEDDDAAIVGFTATPLELEHFYDRLIVCGTTSSLRECGALVPCHTYAPDEPDSKGLKRAKTGEFTEASIRKAIMTATIFGRVYDHWKRLNPDARPALLFAPGVGESLWFAKEFEAKGVRAAHIDGDMIYIDGKEHPADRDLRDMLLLESKAGRLPVICNRFVLREGIDAPWLYHGIFATVFGALTSYVQSGGRILRAHPSLKDVIIQDHGGNWWRHGSLNADRIWDMSRTNSREASDREERLREKKEREPIVCPVCQAVRLIGAKCGNCGHESNKRTRMVIQINGKMKSVEGPIIKPRRIKLEPNTQDLWKKMYGRGKNSGMSFRQMEALFYVENHYYPPRTLDYMPTNEDGWYQNPRDVSPGNMRFPVRDPNEVKQQRMPLK